jgi:hypothetical protein
MDELNKTIEAVHQFFTARGRDRDWIMNWWHGYNIWIDGKRPADLLELGFYDEVLKLARNDRVVYTMKTKVPA